VISLQGPGRQNDPGAFADLAQQLQRIRGELNDVGSAILRAAGIRVSPESMTIERTLEVLGSLDVSGNATFSGDMRIEGTLSLPAGIIDNDALSNPIEFVDAAGNSAGIGYGTTFAAHGVCTLSIPAGFTKFTFSGSSVARCYNSSGATVYLYVQTYSKVVGAAESWGATCQDTIANGFQSTVAAPHSVTHSIPPGATQVQVWASVRTTAPVGADATNFAGIEGVALFSR